MRTDDVPREIRKNFRVSKLINYLEDMSEVHCKETKYNFEFKYNRRLAYVEFRQHKPNMMLRYSTQELRHFMETDIAKRHELVRLVVLDYKTTLGFFKDYVTGRFLATELNR